MYNIYADGDLIYTDIYALGDTILSSPKLVLEDSAAGSLEFTLPVTHRHYNDIYRMKTAISVTKEGEEIWEGRVLEETIDFWNNKKFYCEGALAFLNDTIQPPAEYHNQTVRGFLETLLLNHNANVAEDKYFYVGIVTATDNNDSLYRYTNYETTLECINDKLVSRLGGHLRIRKENGKRYLDYLADYPRTSNQVINFGKNLLDFTKYYNMSDYATVILPLGSMLDESPIEGLYAYLTVESVNGGSIYVTNADAVAQRGWICKVINWNDVGTASRLLTKAQNYLTDLQFDNMELEVSAFDLHNYGVEYDDIQLLDEVKVISKPHGLNRYFPVSKISLTLDNPAETTYTMGTKVRLTLTDTTTAANQDILNRIESLPTAQSIIDSAVDNATQLINNATNGFITIVTNPDGTQELLISNNIDYTQATKIWRFNINGLGYSDNGYEGPYSLALTMDGQIVADAITTGILRGGTSWWNLETGEMHLESLSEIEEIVQNSIGSITYTYAYGDSDTEHPASEEFVYPDMPGRLEGKYIWRATVFRYNDSSSTIKYEMIQGLDGETISIYQVVYAYSDSYGVPPSEGWSLIIPEEATGSYLWTKTVYSNGQIVYSVSRQGKDGAKIERIDLLHYMNTYSEHAATLVGYIYAKDGSIIDTTVGYIVNNELSTNTTVGYLNLEGYSPPPIPTELVTNDSNEANVWTLNMPTYIEDYIYWMSYQTVYSDGTILWSLPMIDDASNQVFSGLTIASNRITSIAVQYESNFNILNDRINSIVERTTTIENTYLSEEGIENIINTYQIVTASELTQTADDITMQFSNTYVSKDDEDYLNLTTNIVFDANGINIGSTTSDTNLQLSPDGVTIQDSSNNPIASMTPTEFVTGDWVMQQADVIFNIFKKH